MGQTAASAYLHVIDGEFISFSSQFNWKLFLSKKQTIFVIDLPRQKKLPTVIKNIRHIRANESDSESKEINHESHEEYNNNSDSTFETSTSILVS